MNVTISPLAVRLAEIAHEAGQLILRHYARGVEARIKKDLSPVTCADEEAEALIIARLRDAAPGVPIIAEEAIAAGEKPPPPGRRFFLVDPLDGTKEFVSRNGEFTVNIALVDGGRPVLGVVHAPVTGRTFWGGAVGVFTQTGDGEERLIACREAPSDGLVAMVSRSHKTPEVDTYLADYNIARETGAGSALKFCLIAEGAADIYPRLGRTMEWDTAAGHAILRFAGGTVEDLDGNELTYGKPDFENPHFIAKGTGVAKATPGE